MRRRGYFGVGIYQPKISSNVGTLLRTANSLGAALVFTIGRRYMHQCTDTMSTEKHVPLYHYETFEDFQQHRPHGAPLVAVELDDRAVMLTKDFVHPERAIYLLGAEDNGLPREVLAHCNHILQLHGERCLNVSVAGSIVLHDRVAKEYEHVQLNIEKGSANEDHQ